MSEENIKKEKQGDTSTGPDQSSGEPKITAAALLLAHEKEIQKIATVLDIIYLQLATVIEVLAEKGVIDPATWANKLDSVGKQIEERMEQENKKLEEKNKIVVPEKKIILPGDMK